MLKRSKGFRRAPRKRGYFIIIILGLLGYGAFYTIENEAEVTLIKLAKARVQNISQECMTKGIEEMRRSLGPELNKVMTINNKDQHGYIISVDPLIQAKIYEIASKNMHKQMKTMEQEDYGIPLGAVLQSNLFSDVGPDIPLKIWPKGSTNLDMDTKIESAGINTVKVTLYLQVTNEIGTLVPLTKEKDIKVKYHYPIASQTMMGEVPENYYYYNNNGKNQGMEGPIPVVPSNGTRKN
ncbi:sporulation protein YunB [Marininema halotolerans]|uniref:Sporulation protein YunB n=1 Tax=Marininema halotolerans TaxID=1155944 RepID=A0A1I6R7R1_9BACL|nr:sporulation protein YunB [Marininema halotolerans]